MFGRTAFCCLILAIAASAQADELSDRLCPILEKIASESAGKDGVAIQASLVLLIGSAYDFDGKELQKVTDGIDASATENCPEARETILKQLQMQSLQQALR